MNRSDNMRYFCSFSYVDKGVSRFGNGTLETPIDPYDNIEGFMELFKKTSDVYDLKDVVLLNYKRVM